MENINPNKNETSVADSVDQAAKQAAFSYQEYWPDFVQDHSELVKSNGLVKDVATHTDKSRARMEERIEDGWNRVGIDASTEAKSFYFRLGSLNSLQGGEEALSKAGIIMQRRGEASLERSEDSGAYEMLIAGCLFHEAGLVSQGSFRASMLNRAMSSYNLVLESQPKTSNFNSQRALRYSYDIQYQRLFDALSDNGIDADKARLMHEDLQLVYIDEFLQYLGQIKNQQEYLKAEIERTANNSRRSELTKKLVGNLYNARGLSLEWFSLVAYRRLIDKRDMHQNTFIRSAMPREEEPWFFKNIKKQDPSFKRATKQMPKHGFDLMVIDIKNQQQSLRPMQLKLGKGVEEMYLPEIEMVGFAYNDPDSLLESLATSARGIRKEYRNQPLDKDEVAILRSTIELFQDRLLAA
ncbi:MAG: hypothetical protein WD061_03475 [Candidatus Saccharimonadales bacterium]